MKKEKVVVKIEGMKCKHCTEHVLNALKNIDGVLKVKVSLANKEAIVYSKSILTDEEIISIIEQLNYKVLSIERN